MVYKWSEGARGLKVDAQEVGEHLENLRGRYNRLTPQVIVNDARKKRSLLHGSFQWDNEIAAESYRIEQAKYLIRHIVVSEENQPEVRAFVSVLLENDETVSYTHIVHAMGEPVLREQVLHRAKNELVTWRQRYSDLQEFAKVHSAIDQMAAV